MKPGPGWPTAAMLVLARHPISALIAVGAGVAAARFHHPGLLVGFGVFAVQGGLSVVTGNRGLPGPVLSPAEQPELTGLITDVAERLGFTDPLAVALIPFPDAGLATTKLRGAEVVTLALGLPLLLTLTEAQLAGLLAHELAHRPHLQDRCTATVLSARGSLADAIAEGARLPRLFGSWLLRRTQPLSFAFESACDVEAARVVGTSAVVQTLELTELQLGVFELAGRWVEQLAEEDAYPEDLFDAVLAALDDPVVRRRVSASLPKRSDLDSHPTLHDRIAALPDLPPGPYGDRRVELRDRDALVARCLRDLVDTDQGTPVRILDDPSRVDTREEDARLALKDVTGVDGLDAFLHALTGDPRFRERLGDEELRSAVTGMAGRLLAASLAERGWRRASPWVHSTLIDPLGRPHDLRAIVGAALESDEGVPPLVELVRS